MARVAAIGAALCCLLGGGVALAQSQADRERALELFREANGLFTRGELHAAYDLYQDAWALHRSFDIACNLGRTEAELQLAVPAAEHLDYCLRTFPSGNKSGLRDAERRYQELYDQVRTQVVAVSITSRPVAVEVLVDGAFMGTGPFQHDLYVAPGERKILVRAKGYRDRQIVISAAAGASETIDIQLDPLTAPTPAVPDGPAAVAATPAESPRPKAAPSQKPASGAEARTIAVASGAGLTLIGLGLGIAFMADAKSTAEQSDRLRAELDGACSPASSSAACQRYQDSVDHEQTSRSIANVALATSGIVGAATVGVWLVLPERAQQQVGAIRPWLAAESGGVAFMGSY